MWDDNPPGVPPWWPPGGDPTIPPPVAGPPPSVPPLTGANPNAGRPLIPPPQATPPPGWEWDPYDGRYQPVRPNNPFPYPHVDPNPGYWGYGTPAGQPQATSMGLNTTSSYGPYTDYTPGSILPQLPASLPFLGGSMNQRRFASPGKSAFLAALTGAPAPPRLLKLRRGTLSGY
jgi:hypothetical protein